MDQKILDAINAKLKSDFKLVKQFDNGNSNKNFLLLNSEGKRIVVKQLHNQPVSFIPIELLIQEHLIEKGVPTPKYKEFSDQEVLLELDGENLTYTDYLESDESLPSLYELGVNIAKFQIAASDLRVELPANWLHPKYWGKLNFKESEIETSEQIKNDLFRLRKELSDSNLPESIIHGDLNLGNVLTSNGKIIAILDLESTESNFRILDLGMSIFQIKPAYEMGYSSLANKIMQGYESLLPLSKEEKEHILTATLYAASASGLWNLSFEGGSSDFLQSYTSLMGRIKDGFNG